MTTKRRTEAQILSQAGPIAKTVRTLRKELGYTQEEFASRVGVEAVKTYKRSSVLVMFFGGLRCHWLLSRESIRFKGS